MADVNRGDRPLSPHLSIYRPQMTWIPSIINRLTGSGLVVTGLLIVWWFLAAATSPAHFAIADGVITSLLGDLVMALSVWALWYHTLGGLRHLYWDTGRGLQIDVAERLSLVIIVLSVVLTVLTLLIV